MDLSFSKTRNSLVTKYLSIAVISCINFCHNGSILFCAVQHGSHFQLSPWRRCYQTEATNAATSYSAQGSLPQKNIIQLKMTILPILRDPHLGKRVNLVIQAQSFSHQVPTFPPEPPFPLIHRSCYYPFS